MRKSGEMKVLNKQWLILCGNILIVYGLDIYYQNKKRKKMKEYQQSNCECLLNRSEAAKVQYEQLLRKVARETKLMDQEWWEKAISSL